MGVRRNEGLAERGAQTFWHHPYESNFTSSAGGGGPSLRQTAMFPSGSSFQLTTQGSASLNTAAYGNLSRPCSSPKAALGEAAGPSLCQHSVVSPGCSEEEDGAAAPAAPGSCPFARCSAGWSTATRLPPQITQQKGSKVACPAVITPLTACCVPGDRARRAGHCGAAVARSAAGSGGK